ncbi:integrase, partial [Sinorhizobium medicae]|nr:integrase [Sinorhizobium medicae]
MRIFDKATCLDPYLASFEQSFSARNYKPATLENYRYHLRCFGRLLDVEGIAPSALTADIAVELGRRLPTTPKAQIKVA